LIPRSADGTAEGTWVLADYLDVVLHIFTPEARGYYKLEDLWGDVPAVELAEVASA
jgi:ribosome-associated protein